MTPAILAFLYGFVAAFLLRRLRRKSRLRPRELRWLVAAGWITIGISFTIAAASIFWLFSGG